MCILMLYHTQLKFADLIGQQGSSVLRLEEARKRDQYHKVYWSEVLNYHQYVAGGHYL